MSIYQDIILDHYHNPHNYKKIIKSTNEVEVSNPLCGDIIQLQVAVTKDKVADIAFSGEGCAISVASASMLTDYARNKSIGELRKMSSADMLKLVGIELSPNRMKCALLSWEALIKVLK